MTWYEIWTLTSDAPCQIMTISCVIILLKSPYHTLQIRWYGDYIERQIKPLESGKVKHELRVTNSNPQVSSSNPRITSSNPWVTSFNQRVTRRKLQVARLKAQVGRLKAWVVRLKAWFRRLKARVQAIKPQVR